jgi:hypothetical protein
VLEVTLNAFTTVRMFLLGQNDRADDLMAGDLRSQKHFPVRKLRVGEFHELTARTHMFPFIFHLLDWPFSSALLLWVFGLCQCVLLLLACDLDEVRFVVGQSGVRIVRPALLHTWDRESPISALWYLSSLHECRVLRAKKLVNLAQSSIISYFVQRCLRWTPSFGQNFGRP